MTEYAFEAAKRSSTTISWSLATQTYAADVSTPFSSVVNPDFVSTITAAFARWSSVSSLVFKQVADAATVPIRIGFGVFTQYGELGETDYHYLRGVLANDTLIRLVDPAALQIAADPVAGYFYPEYDVTLFQVVLHEIGHALGLDHTTDAATVMFPYATSINGDLAAGDIQGINTLYPLFSVAAPAPVQVEGDLGQVDTFDFLLTRYSDPGVPLTINYAVSGAAYPGMTGSIAAVASEFVGGVLPSGQVTFAAGSTTARLTVQTMGNTRPQADRGFAISLSTGRANDSVTVRGTTNALVLDDDGGGSVSGRALGVHRFFDTVDGTHFYSTSLAERNAILLTRPDLVYEGQGLTAIASPANDPAAAPVFRFFDTVTGTHFYSASTAERDTLVATRPGFRFEGTAFYEHNSAQAGDVPVFRFFDTGHGTHFYTASAAERASILASRLDMVPEGVAFYAPSA